MKSLTFNSIKLLIVTKLESSSGYKRTKIAYKIETGSDKDLMPFRIFRIYFLDQ